MKQNGKKFEGANRSEADRESVPQQSFAGPADSEFDSVPPLNIPESQGDNADQAQDQIDWEVRERVNQIRRRARSQTQI